MFQNAYKNNPKYLKITPSLKIIEVTAFAFSYRSSFSVWSIINEERVFFFFQVWSKVGT